MEVVGFVFKYIKIIATFRFSFTLTFASQLFFSCSIHKIKFRFVKNSKKYHERRLRKNTAELYWGK